MHLDKMKHTICSILHHNIKGNKQNTIKQNKLNMESWQLNKTYKEKILNKPHMAKS